MSNTPTDASSTTVRMAGDPVARPSLRAGSTARAPLDPRRPAARGAGPRVRLFGRRRRIPFIAQATATECSVACLAMLLAYHQRRVLRDDIRLALGTGRDGASALALLRAADRLGLQGRGLRVAAARLGELRPGAVLHWQRKHFVVLEGVRAGRATILDPALGCRVFGADELAAGFSGLALELWPKE